MSALTRRMYTAEENLNAIKASENWEMNGPDTKKRRSVGDIPRNSSQSTHSQALGSSLSQSNASSAGFSNSANGNPTSFFPAKAYPMKNGTSSATPSVTPITTNGDSMNIDTPDEERTPSVSHCGTVVGRTPSPMTISLDGLPSSLDTAKMFAWTHNNNGTSSSAPPTSHADHVMCPTCGKAITDTMTMSKISSNFTGSPSGSPLVVPPGPLAAAAFESGMSAVEELRLLKAQVQDVARVCNAVARGDLSQKITVPVQGVVMVQLKDVINTMVCVMVSLNYIC
jgi:osomolarity two-component system sensor histidine kinase NIK1